MINPANIHLQALMTDQISIAFEKRMRDINNEIVKYVVPDPPLNIVRNSK
jgi:hypothetical protein